MICLRTHIQENTLLANGLRYPLVGETRQRYFDGTHSKIRKVLENAQTPTSRVHAVLGALTERRPILLETNIEPNLTKLYSQQKYWQSPKRSRRTKIFTKQIPDKVKNKFCYRINPNQKIWMKFNQDLCQ